MSLSEELLSVMVVGPPGIRRNSLISLLRSHVRIGTIHLADDLHAAQTMLADACIHFVIADTALSSAHVLDLIQWVRAATPDVHCIALTDGAEEVDAYMTAGAAQVLYRSVLDEHLLHAALAAHSKKK